MAAYCPNATTASTPYDHSFRYTEMQKRRKLAAVIEHAKAALAKGDVLEALLQYSTAARSGDVDSQYIVGCLYRHGSKGPRKALFEMGLVEQSHEEANDMFGLAAQQGHAGAQGQLGLSYERGYGVQKNFNLAAHFYRLGCHGNVGQNGLAANNLGALYETGELTQSFATAKRLYELAKENGETEYASDNLDNLNAAIEQHCPLLGQRVLLRGLSSMAHAALNGSCGAVVDCAFGERETETGSWRADSGRYKVRLDGPGGGMVQVHFTNVEKESEEAAAARFCGYGR